MSDSNGAATIPSGSNGAAMSFASSSSINAGVSSGQSIGTINYTDSRSNGNSIDQSQQRFINPLKKRKLQKY